ncbi:MAG: FtsW/RodA/SpoVE family cell cycle protein [Victivallales bacterium]|nr:FtsW/RodA/SpoVE family cell cycle protein [Victivallales bacterium]
MPIGRTRFNTARGLLLVPLIALTAWGVAMIYSTTSALPRGPGLYEAYYMKRQLLWLGTGSILAGAIWRLDYRKAEPYRRLALCAVAIPLLYLALASLLWNFPAARGLVRQFPLIPFTARGPLNGAFRWLRLGPASIQPSEFAKPLLIYYLAAHFRLPLRTESLRRGVAEPVILGGAILTLIFAGRDLSSTVITGAIMGAMLFIAGVRLRYLLLLGILGLAFVGLVLVSSPVRRKRVTDYMAQQEDKESGNEQVLRAKMAMGSGGVSGMGFTGSRFKRLGLPEAHTDFIVAIVGEEAGFLGVLGVLLAYVLLTGAIFWIAAQTDEPFGQLLAIGVGLTFCLQAFVNVSVVSGFCPTTGVTAPFLSYGGSSMISCLLCTGLVMSVSRVAEREASAEGDGVAGPHDRQSKRLNLQREGGTI